MSPLVVNESHIGLERVNNNNNDKFLFLDELFPFTQIQSLHPSIIIHYKDDSSASEDEKRRASD